VLCGVISVLVKAAPAFLIKPVSPSFAGGFGWLLTGVQGTASTGAFWTLSLFFLKAGAFVFGSGLAIVPFLYGGAVTQFHWLTEQQFLDAIAVAMITPGPVVISAAFIGYLVAGFLGGAAAATAVFVPPFLIVVLAAPYYRRFAANPQVKAFVQGVTAAAVGAIAGAAVILGKRALVDIPTLSIGLITFVVLLQLRKVPEPVLIIIAGGIGLLLHHRVS
jgi:chromate transporter